MSISQVLLSCSSPDVTQVLRDLGITVSIHDNADGTPSVTTTQPDADAGPSNIALSMARDKLPAMMEHASKGVLSMAVIQVSLLSLFHPAVS